MHLWIVLWFTSLASNPDLPAHPQTLRTQLFQNGFKSRKIIARVMFVGEQEGLGSRLYQSTYTSMPNSDIVISDVGCPVAWGEETEECRRRREVEGRDFKALSQPVALQPAAGQATSHHHTVQESSRLWPQERQGSLSAWPGISVAIFNMTILTDMLSRLDSTFLYFGYDHTEEVGQDHVRCHICWVSNIIVLTWV